MTQSDTAVLKDVLEPGLRVVFCGTAAGAVSARVGAYYAGPGNRFWPTLYEVGLTPRELAPNEYRSLLDWRIGLTDVCKTASGMDHQLDQGAYDVDRLEEAIRGNSPAVLAFTSKRAAAVALGLRRTSDLTIGKQDMRFADVTTWVLPSPSGAARGHWSIGAWQDLAAHLRDQVT